MWRRRKPPSPTSHVGLAASLGCDGIIMVLFETPSGFAIFSFDGVRLLLPDAMKNIWANFGRIYRAKCAVWRKEFQFFGDKSAAINLDTGVSDELSEMLKRWCRPGQKLAVAKCEYKTIIESRLGISCLYDETVMELMWGLKNLMYSLVPEEKSKLGRDDSLQMSQGLKMLLNRYGFDVKPEMVSDRIIGLACFLYDCDENDRVHSKSLHVGAKIIEDVSGLNTQRWSIMKLATALKMICYPGERIVVGDPEEMFSRDVLSTLRNDARKYEGKMYKNICLIIYKEVVTASELRAAKRRCLESVIKQAEKAYEADQANGLRCWGMERSSKRSRSQ
ncbi:unnamed protein product [Urochloa humidicola]